jgi:hypothetical protein
VTGVLRGRRRLLALTLLTVGIAVAGVFGAGVRSALAAPHAPAIEMRVIHATQTDAGVSIDPALRDLPQLTRDVPFVRYNTYKLLGHQSLPLEAGKPATSDLPNGRVLAVTLVEPPAGARYHVRAEIGEPGKKAFLKLLEVTASGNEPFFVGGQSYQGGTLFLELVVRP